MYQSIAEYIVNADLFYRLWMVAEMQTPTPRLPRFSGPNQMKIAQPRQNWLPELANSFEDVRLVPSLIMTDEAEHMLDSEFRFHTGNKTPTIKVAKMALIWGIDWETHVNDKERKPFRPVGPAKITMSNLRMWHHQDVIHRRRGDAIICDQIEFEWNTKENSGGCFRDNGPFKVVIKGFHAQYKMGVPVNPYYDNLTVSWGNENGIRLGEERVQEVINRNDIQVNYLMCDSAFLDDGEAFIFWDEVGRQQAA